MVNFMELVSASLEWTKVILFKPFRLKKWLTFCFIAFLAGVLYGGGSFNLNLPRESPSAKKSQSTAKSCAIAGKDATQASPSFQESLRQIKTSVQKRLPWLSRSLAIKIIVGAAIIAIIIVSALVIFFTWLHAHFVFIFLDGIRNNDASIKAPFKRFHASAQSYFWLSLAVQTIFSFFIALIIGGCIVRLYTLGAFNYHPAVGFKTIALACIPFVAAFCLLIPIGMIITFLINDFLTIIMCKEQTTVKPAWRATVALLKLHINTCIKYGLVKIGLSFCSWLILGFLNMAIVLMWIIPTVIVVMIGTLGYKFIPQPFNIILVIIAAIIFIAVAMALWILYFLIMLPFGIFFRTLNMKFIARIDDRFNLFALTNTKEVNP
ncbi:MAG: hypothetical protein KBA46_06905 [Candidatus Omnitrophica bacterium]|nr:hypothetical protein [Candidatus Omnitrophota bacterium]